MHAHLREHAVGRRVHRVDVASLQVLKTFTPPWTELQGREVTGAGRFTADEGLWSPDSMDLGAVPDGLPPR